MSLLNICTLSDIKELDGTAFTPLEVYCWESKPVYRPPAFFKLALVKNQGLCCVLMCREKSPKTVYTHRDSPIYKDSCMELFAAPVLHRDEYINVECNSAGAYLCEFGSGRDCRVRVADICRLSPEVIPFLFFFEMGILWCF